MKTLSNPERLQVFESLKKAFSDVEIPGDKMMNWDDIRQLSSYGFIVGSHSTSHIPLVRIENDDELWQELKGSGEAIRSQLGTFPNTISYPNGNCDDRVREYAGKAGYKYGLIVGQRFYNTDLDPNMSIPRLELYNEPFFKVKLRMSGIIRIFRQGVYEQRQK
jgi:peptidoglycan/xylan/chitin deacetylase (PgdA/CDA1 family)